MVVNPASFVAAHEAEAARERVLNGFRKAGAQSPGSARPLADLGLEEDATLRGFLRSRIVRRLDDGRSYLDEEALARNAHRNTRIGLVVGVIIAGGVAAALLLR
jgi:hypothetical protein